MLPAKDKKTNTPKDPNISKPSPTVIKNFNAVTLRANIDTTLVSQYIRSNFQDSKKNLWFGTLSEGVVNYDAKRVHGMMQWNLKKSMTTVLTYKETKIGTLYLTLKQTKLSMLDFEYYPLKPGIDSVLLKY